MTEPIRVFISSKHAEFEIERSVLAHKIGFIPLLEPVTSEEWPPQRSESMDVYLDQVRNSPIYLGIFGKSYSHHTEAEYRAALENQHREMLLYIKQNTVRKADPELAHLIDEMRERHVLHYFNHIGELLPRLGDHLSSAVVRMVSLLQRLGERRPAGRSRSSVLEKRWLQTRAPLIALGLPSQPDIANAVADVLSNTAADINALFSDLS